MKFEIGDVIDVRWQHGQPRIRGIVVGYTKEDLSYLGDLWVQFKDSSTPDIVDTAEDEVYYVSDEEVFDIEIPPVGSEWTDCMHQDVAVVKGYGIRYGVVFYDLIEECGGAVRSSRVTTPLDRFLRIFRRVS